MVILSIQIVPSTQDVIDSGIWNEMSVYIACLFEVKVYDLMLSSF